MLHGLATLDVGWKLEDMVKHMQYVLLGEFFRMVAYPQSIYNWRIHITSNVNQGYDIVSCHCISPKQFLWEPTYMYLKCQSGFTI